MILILCEGGKKKRECWQLSSKPLLTRACTWGVWGSVVEIVFQCEGHFHHLLLRQFKPKWKTYRLILYIFSRRCSLRIQRKTHGWDASRNYSPFSHASSAAFERETESVALKQLKSFKTDRLEILFRRSWSPDDCLNLCLVLLWLSL